jgi:hypothetical protein
METVARVPDVAQETNLLGSQTHLTRLKSFTCQKKEREKEQIYVQHFCTVE